MHQWHSRRHSSTVPNSTFHCYTRFPISVSDLPSFAISFNVSVLTHHCQLPQRNFLERTVGKMNMRLLLVCFIPEKTWDLINLNFILPVLLPFPPLVNQYNITCKFRHFVQRFGADSPLSTASTEFSREDCWSFVHLMNVQREGCRTATALFQIRW
jgi:hypothetical protein